MAGRKGRGWKPRVQKLWRRRILAPVNPGQGWPASTKVAGFFAYVLHRIPGAL
jgi:hypothetical protein